MFQNGYDRKGAIFVIVQYDFKRQISFIGLNSNSYFVIHFYKNDSVWSQGGARVASVHLKLKTQEHFID